MLVYDVYGTTFSDFLSDLSSSLRCQQGDCQNLASFRLKLCFLRLVELAVSLPDLDLDSNGLYRLTCAGKAPGCLHPKSPAGRQRGDQFGSAYLL